MARGNNRGAGNAGRAPRRPRIKVGYTDLARQADGTYSCLLIAEVRGGRGDEQIMFWIDLAPQGTEISVDEDGHAQTPATGLSGTNHVVKAALVDGDRRIVRGTEVSCTMVIAKVSKFAKSAALRRDEIELRRLERELRDLVREPSASAREIRDLQEQVAVIKARRERDELSRGPTLLERAAKNVGDQVLLAKLRRELREIGKIPAKDIVRPVVECICTDGSYIVSGCVVYKDASFAANYPVLVSIVPHRGVPEVRKILTDEHGYFEYRASFTERHADIHVIVGGTGGFEEFFDDLEGPRRHLGGRYNWKLWMAWAATLALTIIGFLWVGFGSEPERTMLTGLPTDLQEVFGILHPEWKPVEPGFFSWLGGWMRTGYWTLVGLAWLGSLVFTPIAFSDEFGLLMKSITGMVSRRKRAGSQGSGPSHGGEAASTTSSKETSDLLKGKGPWVAFIVTLGAFVFDEIRERWMAKRARRMANKIVGD